MILIAIHFLPDNIDRLLPALCFSSILAIVHLVSIPRVTARFLGVSTVELSRPSLIPATALTIAALITFGVHQANFSPAVEVIVFLAAFAVSWLAIRALLKAR